MPLDDVDHAVDKRHPRNQVKHARGDGDLRSRIENHRHRSVHRSREGRRDEDDIVIESLGLHPLLEVESEQRGGKDDAYRTPLPAEKPAEGCVGQSDENQCENRVQTRPGDDLVIAAPNLCKGQAKVAGVPAQGAELRVQLEADRQRRNVRHLAVNPSALVVVNREGHHFLKGRHHDAHAERLAQTFRIAHHARGMHSGPHQPGGILRNELRDSLQFRFRLHFP